MSARETARHIPRMYEDALEAAESILWMAEKYAEGGGSHGVEMRDYTEAERVIRAASAARRERAAATGTGRFELRKDEDADRLYWWGAEDGWKDATEIGEDGVLTLDARHFAVGTVLLINEPESDRE